MNKQQNDNFPFDDRQTTIDVDNADEKSIKELMTTTDHEQALIGSDKLVDALFGQQ